MNFDIRQIHTRTDMVGNVVQLEAVVSYGQKQAQIKFNQNPPLEGDPTEETVYQSLKELAAAILRIPAERVG